MRVLLALVLLSGCGSSTQLLVEICTDYGPEEVGRIQARAVDAESPESPGRTAEWEGSALEASVLSFGVEGARGRRVRLELRLFDIDDALLVERVVETGFDPGASVTVAVRLPRACAGADCGDETCGDFGVCEPVSVPVDAWRDRTNVCLSPDAGPSECDRDGDGVENADCGGMDCDDDDANRFPGNTELCDTTDQDCDPCTVGTLDADMDGATSNACENPGASAASCGDDIVIMGDFARGSDCDDGDGMARPGAEERCNLQDDDCDGVVDEGLATTLYWPDADDDGYGDPSRSPVESCSEPDGYAVNDDDCADDAASRNPEAGELCNVVDDDCDGAIDEITGNTFYRDEDGDGFGDDASTLVLDSCTPPDGYVNAGGDCRPSDAASYPDATELCDLIDNDCSSATPGGADPSEDMDGDGHAPSGATCEGGFPADDCADDDAYAHPGAPEYCSGTDADCDGTVDESVDSQCAGGGCAEGCVGSRRLALSGQSAENGTGCFAGATDVLCWGTTRGSTVGQASIFRSTGDELEVLPVSVAALAATEIAMTDRHACARLADGSIRCWGANGFGQLGNGGTAPTTDLEQPPVTDAVQIAVGWAHSCALTRFGEVWCWGRNSEGQLGLGHRTDRSNPTRVSALDRVVELVASAGTTCARRYEGDVWCWGSVPDSPSPVRILGGAERIAIGGFDSFTDVAVACAELSSGWQCWGTGTGGAIGAGLFGPSATPIDVTVATNIVALAPHGKRGCAVLASGGVRCWGEAREGRLGTNTPASSLEGVDVAGIDDAVDVVCGEAICCAERPSGFTCWGAPLSAVHGDGRARDGSAAELVARLSAVTQVVVGSQHACALESGLVSCWGDNAPALGTGDRDDRYEPEAIGFAAEQVDTDQDRTCLRQADGSVWCWGNGYAGDAAETVSAEAPVQVDDGSMDAASDIAVGQTFSCALDTAGAAWCWGSGSNGTCGNGTTDCRAPATVSGGLTFDEIDAGARHVCARDGGAVWCWGLQSFGRLGNGVTSGDANTPVQVMNLTDAVEISVGDATTCARRMGGGVRCWGAGSSGETGDGSGATQPIPVDVMGLSDAEAITCDEGCFAYSTTRGWLAWGDNVGDWMGVGSMTDSLVPTPAGHGVDFVDIELGSSTACGIEAAGTLRCWGGLGAASGETMLGYSIYSDLVLP